MLRSLRERLLVSLTPTGISWLRLGSGLRTRILAMRTVEVDAEYGPEPWQGAVAALRAEAEAWRKDPAPVTVVLSNHFARYLLVPPSDGVRGIEEEQALARFHFAKVHGERCRAWEIRMGATSAGASQIACAIDTTLLESLRGCFPLRGRLRLVSVQPYLMSAFNFWHKQFPKAGAWFLVVEADRACLALVAGGRWITVRSVKGGYDQPDEWVDLLDRERWRVALDQTPNVVLVHTANPATEPPREGVWRLLVTNAFWSYGGSSLPEDSRYIAALTAS